MIDPLVPHLTAEEVLRVVVWMHLVLAAALLLGVVLWLVCCALESGNPCERPT